MATVTASKRNAQLLADSAEISGNLVINGSITAPGFNKSNWDTAYGWGDHASEGYATQAYVNNAVSNLVDSAPTTLDTLNELATALGDDPNFAATVSDSIGSKVSKSGDTMTGTLTVPNLTIGSGNKIKFANNDYIRYDDVANRFHFDVDGGTSNASIQASGGFIGNASSASKWATARSHTVTLTGDVTGSATQSVDGTGNKSWILNTVVGDDSHVHHRLDSTDDRDVKPNTTGISSNVQAIKPFFTSLGGMTGTANTDYQDLLVLDTYSDTSGGKANAISMDKSDGAMRIWNANQGDNTWGTGQRVFADNYHPNADKWTTARTHTVTLTGEVTGTASQSVDGSGNRTWTISTTLNNSALNDQYVNKTGDTMTGGLTISGSLSRGTYPSLSQYHTGADNIVLKGNSAGISGIFFESEKDGTNINHPTDFGFIQYHAYGTSTSGEANELIIGVSNDADDNVIINAPNVNGFKFRTGASATDYTVWHAGNFNPSSYLLASNYVDNYADSVAFNTSTGVLTIGRTGSLADLTVDLDGRYLTSETDNQTLSWNGTNGVLSISGGNSVDLDGRYLQSYSETDTLQSVCSRGNTTNTDVIVNGLLTATTKSFTIDHPTKEGYKLRYGSLEGPENGVYVRGRLKDNNVIELPDVWVGLVHEDSITVSLTAIGKSQEIWVEDIMENKVIVGGDNVNCFYHVFAERKDVDKLVTEFQEVE